MRRSANRAVAAICGVLLAVCFLLVPTLVRAETPPGAVPSGFSPAVPLGDLLVTRYATGDGLASTSLTDLLVSREGYLWISSYAGLSRFAGHGFKVYDRAAISKYAAAPGTAELATDGFHSLAEDEGGNLWIGTQGSGLILYRNGHFRRVDPENSVNHTVRSLLVDRDGRVWVGTREHGAFLTDGERLEPVEHPSLRGAYIVLDIHQDRSGAIWLATEGAGVVRFLDGEATSYTAADGLVHDLATSVEDTVDGRLFFGTLKGLSVFEDGRFTTIPELDDTQVFHLLDDDRGCLWIASNRGLMRRHPDGRVEILGEHEGVPLTGLSGLAFDREGSLWVSSTVVGLLQFEEGKFRNFKKSDGLASHRVNVLYEDGPGRVLVGTDGGVMSLIDVGVRAEVGNRRIETVELPWPDVRLRSFHRDAHGRLWIGSYAGLLRLDPNGEITAVTVDEGLPSNLVRLIRERGDGRLWIATRNGGLAILDPDLRRPVEILDQEAGLLSDFVFAVESFRGGWAIGTNGGLTLVAPDGTMTYYRSGHELPGSLVFNIHVDAENVLWIATDNGFVRLAKEDLFIFDQARGLPNNEIFDLDEDDKGHVWLSSTFGVLRIAKSELEDVATGGESKPRVLRFDENEGMVSRQCTGATTFLETSDGRFWFPTLRGVAVVDPGNVEINRVVPPVRIDGFTADGEQVDLVSRDGSSRSEIPPGRRIFELDFSVLSFQAPGRVEVRYRLEGFDESWKDAAGKRRVRYTNLPPGEYAFRVVGSNNDGVWNEEGASLPFRVQPFFYETLTFKLLLAATLVVLVLALYRLRVRSVERRSHELEEIVGQLRRAETERQRSIEALEAKNTEMEGLVYTISHDLKSPLFTIRGFLGLVKKDLAGQDLERAEHDLGRILAATDHMDVLLQELLDFSRIGRFTTEPEDVSPNDLAHEAMELVRGRIEHAGVEITIEPDMPSLHGERRRLLEVYQNLIENAVKFSRGADAPKVEVGCRQDGGETVYYVRDGGRGIDPRYHEKIFGLFDRLDSQEDGTGVGLAIVRRVVEVHGGRVWVESEGEGRGATFCFVLDGRKS